MAADVADRGTAAAARRSHADTAPLNTTPRGFRGAAAGYGPAAILLIAGIAAWQFVGHAAHAPAWLLPSPWRIATTLWTDRGLLDAGAWATAEEAWLGFGAALILAVLFALAIRFSALAESALWPLLVASQTVPIPAVAPLLVLWLGYGMLPKIVVVALICFFPVVVTAVDGLRAADPDTLDALRTLGGTRGRLFWSVEAPGALPAVASGVKTSAAYAVVGAVLGEWLGGTRGLGVVMVQASAQLLTARVFAAVVWLAALGIATFAAAALAERAWLPWYHTAERGRRWR